jgi:hypothetical protein
MKKFYNFKIRSSCNVWSNICNTSMQFLYDGRMRVTVVLDDISVLLISVPTAVCTKLSMSRSLGAAMNKESRFSLWLERILKPSFMAYL